MIIDDASIRIQSPAAERRQSFPQRAPMLLRARHRCRKTAEKFAGC